jgi:hypothetical protein
MIRPSREVVLLVTLVLALATRAEAQKVKLKNEGIKGTFVTASCKGPSLCTLLDLSATAAGQFLYVTQVCFTNTAIPPGNEAAMRISTDASGEIAAAIVAEFETKCVSFDPARLVQPNDTLECHESKAVATSHCSVSGVTAAK